MHVQLTTYKSNLDEINRGVRDMRASVSTLSTAVSAAKFVAGQLKTVDETTDKVEKGIEVTDVMLGILGFVSPLKTPVKALEKVLDKAEKPVDKVDEKLDQLTGKDDTSTPGKEADGEFLAKLETNLGKVGVALNGVSDTLTITDFNLSNASKAMAGFKPALQAALRPGEAWSGTYAALNNSIESQLGARNALYSDLKTFYDSVKIDVDAFLKVMIDIDFGEIFDSFVDLDAITAIFDFLEKPLDIAAGLIAPIQPLLNAIDSLVGLIINPIIDYVTDTLGVDALIDSVASKITGLLPAIDLLDGFFNLAQKLQDFLEGYALDTLGTMKFLGDVEDVFFGGLVGKPESGPTGWGTDIPGILTGDDGIDILDALGGRDIIRAGGGDDIIVAGEGSDLIDGGAGSDLIYFNASFSEYELSRVPNTDTFIVSHLLPKTPKTNTGVDVLANLQDEDHVVFTDISFTGAELRTAIIGGSVLYGDSDDNLMFLNSSGDNSSGFHIAMGRAGDDRIFGSTENDRLFGQAGNDTLIPGAGDDELFGGSGRDTFQVLEGVNRRLTIDLQDGTSFGEGNDSLDSIENLVVSPHQKHKINANDADNTIFTGDGIDVINGLGGDDIIDSGGEQDFLVGGQGADVLNAGSDRDVMVSGSRAVRGVSDLYIGGDGYDTVAYTGNSNTIKFDIADVSDDPGILQTLKDYMQGLEASGPVEIRGDTGKIIRFNDQGTRITTDVTREVEAFVGSDKDDLLLGGPVADLLHGAAGNDIIRTGGTENINGGDGDDRIFAQEVEGGSRALQIDGGSGFDVLDLSGVSDARWFYKIETAISLQLRALKTSTTGEDLRNANNAFFSIKPYNIEQITLGNYADHVIYEPGSSSTALIYLKAGNDRFDGENGFADVYAGAGDDKGNFNGGGGGIFRGAAGNDYAVFDDTDRDNRAFMGADQDVVRIERFFGHADGGRGYDTVSFDVSFKSRIVADLAAGTVVSFKGEASNNSDQVGMTLSGFEQLIATEFNDSVAGSSRDEQFLGRSGNDGLQGRAGRDKLYGGAGDDNLQGGGGNDLLHGGAGNDLLAGGGGNDTASYAWAAPDGIDGDLVAGNFGGVSVSLISNSATGASGTDTLISIENVFGSNGDDILQGNGASNLLSGEDGNDQISGAGGDDILVTGAGMDTVRGGNGDDRVVVGVGTKTLKGGNGFDTLDFGTAKGTVTIDFNTKSYAANFVDKVPVWLQLDTNGDGVNDINGTESRLFNGVWLSPQMVLEADPFNANSHDDASRILPESDDPEFELFLIREKDQKVASSGTFASFEAVIGGTSGATLLLTTGVDRFDGRNSAHDRIDLSDLSQAVTYNMKTGATNLALLSGDVLTGVEGVLGSSRNDILTGHDGANSLYGRNGNDTLHGGKGNDKIYGGANYDTLYGGKGNDTIWGGNGRDKVFLGDGNDVFHDNGQKNANGNDLVKGGKGKDIFYDGGGNDAYHGGSGADLFVFSARHGRDTIADFTPGQDHIRFEIPGLRFADLTFQDLGTDLRITTGSGKITLLNTDPADLGADDFLFL